MRVDKTVPTKIKKGAYSLHKCVTTLVVLAIYLPVHNQCRKFHGVTEHTSFYTRT